MMFSRRQTAGSPGDKQLVLCLDKQLVLCLDKQLVLQETNSWFSKRQTAGSLP
jgi:hypothetical protein